MGVEVREKQIIDFQFHVAPDLKTAELRVETQARFMSPTDKEDISGLVEVKLTVKSKEADMLSITMLEHIIFSFDKRQEDFFTAMKSAYEEMGEKIVFDDFDKALEGLGKIPMKLNERK